MASPKEEEESPFVRGWTRRRRGHALEQVIVDYPTGQDEEWALASNYDYEFAGAMDGWMGNCGETRWRENFCIFGHGVMALAEF